MAISVQCGNCFDSVSPGCCGRSPGENAFEPERGLQEECPEAVCDGPTHRRKCVAGRGLWEVWGWEEGSSFEGSPTAARLGRLSGWHVSPGTEKLPVHSQAIARGAGRRQLGGDSLSHPRFPPPSPFLSLTVGTGEAGEKGQVSFQVRVPGVLQGVCTPTRAPGRSSQQPLLCPFDELKRAPSGALGLCSLFKTGSRACTLSQAAG